MQVTLDRFGSNIRAQEGQSRLMNILQGNRFVRENTSKLESLLGRLNMQGQSTLINIYVCGLQPYLAREIALKNPMTIAQASEHAENKELAIGASQHPGVGAALGQSRTRQTTASGGRGGAQGGQKTVAQGRGRKTLAKAMWGQGFSGKRGGGWNRVGRSRGLTAILALRCSIITADHMNVMPDKVQSQQAMREVATVEISTVCKTRHVVAQEELNVATEETSGAATGEPKSRVSMLYMMKMDWSTIEDEDGVIILGNEEENTAASQRKYKNLEK